MFFKICLPCVATVHLWKFEGGYPVLNDHKYILRTNEVSYLGSGQLSSGSGRCSTKIT